MNAILLVVTSTPPGDDLTSLAWALLGVTMFVAAVATWIVTPKGEKH